MLAKQETINKLRDLILNSEGKTLEDELIEGCLGYVPQNYDITGTKVYNSPAIVSETWYSNNGGNRVGYLSPMDSDGFRGKHHCKVEDFEILGLPITLDRVLQALGEKGELDPCIHADQSIYCDIQYHHGYMRECVAVWKLTLPAHKQEEETLLKLIEILS